MGLARGAFCLSLDFELLWGTVDLEGDRFRRACEREREQVIPRLLDLLREFEMSATWCIVGHLFLGECRPSGGRAHPEIVRPHHSWCRGDWLAHDTGGTEATSPVLLGKSLVQQILSCPVRQEIGSHSFSHVVFGDPGCSRAAAQSELEQCRRLASEMGVEMRSFAFPRNSVGHLDVLAEQGFRCYRGPHWDHGRELRPYGLGHRLRHLWGILWSMEPPIVEPEWEPAGLWNIPGSMVYFPAHGVRALVPVSLRVKRAVRGLDAAARDKKIFHLWFHPTNLADRTDAMFDGLRAILAHAAALRKRGELDFRTMSQLIPEGPTPTASQGTAHGG